MSERGIVLAFGNHSGFHDASLGALPPSSLSKGDYVVVAFAGAISGIGFADKGNVLLAVKDTPTVADDFDLIDADEPVPKDLYSLTGLPAAGYALRRNNPSYSGHAIKVRRSSDSSTQDIGFNVDGSFDSSALTTFLAGSDAYVDTWYDQVGSNHITQSTTGNQMKLVVESESGEWAIDKTSGYLDKSTFIGAQSASCVSIVWKYPKTSYTTAVGGIDFGSGTSGFIAPRHTTGFAPIVYTYNSLLGTQSKGAEIETVSGAWRVSTTKFAGNDYTGFDNGVLCSSTTTLNAFPNSRITVGKHDYAQGNGYISEVHVWDSSEDPSAQVIFNNVKEAYPNFFPSVANLFVTLGDSNSTSYFVDPNYAWQKTAFDYASVDHYHCVANGGWTLADLIAREDRAEWYLNNLAHTTSYAIIFAGTNDLLTVSDTTAFTRLKTLAEDLKTAGFDNVVVVTCPPRFHTTNPGTSAAAAAFQTSRLAFNAAILADTSGDFTAVVDIESLAIGVNGEQNNATYYCVDNTHLNTAGQAQLGAAIGVVVAGLI